MADALCGPANPLQSFRKQTSLDRTLQQDRTVSSRPFEEVFRSSPGANAGILDAEFEAFQAGHPLEGAFPQHQQSVLGPAFANHGPESQRPGAPSWAADFQSLQLKEARASPIQQSQFRQQAPIQRTAPGAWHQDFVRQHIQATSDHQPQQRALGGSSIGGLYNNNFNALNHSGISPTIARQQQPERQADIQYDQVDMERAFEEVAIEQAGVQKPPPPVYLAQDFVDMRPSEEIRIGSDAIYDEASQDEQKHIDMDEADELARTAGLLLDNLKHDQSQKFQNSGFLSLMRQIRDREVHVEGDKLVDTPQPLHPGGQFYPNDTLTEAMPPYEHAADAGSSATTLA